MEKYLVQWEDQLLFVIKKYQILEPQKDQYIPGEIIVAAYNKKRYEAVICDITQW